MKNVLATSSSGARAPLTERVYRIEGDRLDFRVLLITKHVES